MTELIWEGKVRRRQEDRPRPPRSALPGCRNPQPQSSAEGTRPTSAQRFRGSAGALVKDRDRKGAGKDIAATHRRTSGQAGQILRPPPGGVIRASIAISSWVRGESWPAAAVSRICSGLFAPGITVETAGWERTNCTAS